MKCHPFRWVWGLLPIAIFSVLAAMDIRSRVEADLIARTQEALQQANLGWAKVRFEGRDGILSGQAEDESEPGKAIQLATGIPGVRILDGQPELLRKVEPFTWSATHRDGKVMLAGFVPNEKTRKAILTAAKSTFPQADISDKMELARGNPPVGDWLEGVKFGIKQLATLKSGKAELSGLGVSLEGEAPTSAAFASVRTALTTGLPKVMKLNHDRVIPPVVSPYTWQAKLAGNQVVLTGHAPSDKVRDEIVARAKKAFGKTPVVDKMDLASGAPDGLEKATFLSLDQLGTLQEGTAELKGRDLSLSGVAADEAVAEATRKSFKTNAPQSYKTAEAIKALKAVVSPYVTKIDATASTIDVAGHVPTETERTALLSAVKTRFPGRTINDRLQIAGGEPAGYEACLMSGVSGLGKLGQGRAVLTDKTIEVTGQTEDEALAIALPGDVRSTAKGSCDTKVLVAYDDSKKRKSADDQASRAKAEADAVEKARRDAEVASEKARRESELAAEKARREAADKAAADAAKVAAVAAAAKQAASVCEGDLRSAANSGTIQFERASNVLSKSSIATVRALSDIAKKCANVLIEIEGHTDSEGVPERNQPLSERRAQAVVDFLVDSGVDAARIKAVGYGDTKPVAPNDTADNRAKNRRIEFSVKSQ